MAQTEKPKPKFRVIDKDGNIYQPSKKVVNEDHYWDEKNWDEFIELKNKIKDAAFNDNNKMIRLEMPDIPFSKEPEPKKQDCFLTEYAKVLWGLKRSMKSDAAQCFLDDNKDSAKEILQEKKKDLKDTGFSKRAIGKVLTLLKKDLDKMIGKSLDTDTGKHFVYPSQTPESPAWIDRENDAICKVRNLYKEYTPLQKDRHIEYNMAYVFKKIVFWPHGRKESEEDRVDRCRERIHKRIETIKKDPFSFPSKVEIS